MTRSAKGVTPTREFTRGVKRAGTGPVECQKQVLSNWDRVINSKVIHRGGVDMARVNWKGMLFMYPTDMRVRVSRPSLWGVRV